jgi:hypothetical protein
VLVPLHNICKVGLGILVHIHSRDNCRDAFVLMVDYFILSDMCG